MHTALLSTLLKTPSEIHSFDSDLARGSRIILLRAREKGGRKKIRCTSGVLLGAVLLQPRAPGALDLAEARLPRGSGLRGPLVLLIGGHDRSTPVWPQPLCHPLSISPYLPPRWPPIFSFSSILPFLPPRLPRCLIEGELRGGCSWRGPLCLVITSLFITRANGPRGEGNNNKLIEYGLKLNRKSPAFHFGLSPAALADETASD